VKDKLKIITGKVVRLERQILNEGEIDGLDYLKRKGEHLLAVKLQKFRRGELALPEEFISELQTVIRENEDHLL